MKGKVMVVPGNSSRFLEIDRTKGFAALLMIMAHCSGGNVLLPFGNFGAALFYFCSGMNTMLFLQKNRQSQGLVRYNILFSAILFLGGYTQIIIAHPLNRRIVPEFLQFNALGIVLLLLLFKICRGSGIVGCLFPMPFILHVIYQSGWPSFLHTGGAVWRPFLFGDGGFPLFPWSGFLLFGVFLLEARKRRGLLWRVWFVSAILSAISIWILRIPVRRIDMSLSYFLLGLFVLSLLFFLFHHSLRLANRSLLSRANRQLELVGQNSLMFVYLHYGILKFLVPGIPDFSGFLELGLQTLLAFLFCAVFIQIYSWIKLDLGLFFPASAVILLLVVIRYSDFFRTGTDWMVMDLVIGLLFAFLYVQLRRKLKWVLTGTAV